MQVHEAVHSADGAEFGYSEEFLDGLSEQSRGESSINSMIRERCKKYSCPDRCIELWEDLVISAVLLRNTLPVNESLRMALLFSDNLSDVSMIVVVVFLTG